jgi:hypothetical protein
MPRSSAKETPDSDFNFSNEQKIMQMFCGNAKTYVQLSGAVLGLTLTFAHEILHIPADQSIVDFWMVVMWGCFLAAIISGMFYQYPAVKHLESELPSYSFKGWGWLAPGSVYGIMLGAFYGGTLTFTVYAIVRLSQLPAHN